MKLRRYIGDTHGKYRQYKRLIGYGIPSVQVGDMGVGFRRYSGPRVGEFFANPPHAVMVRADARFIRGNHDNPGACRGHSQFIPDGTIEDGIMYIGGAVSIDKALRKENYTWWADEELSTPELYQLTDKYIEARPEFMVTHECPEEVASLLCLSHGRSPKLDPQWSSRTRQAFQSMWSAHSPRLWVFGHWHLPFDHVLNGTRFICLPELAFIDVDIDTWHVLERNG